MEFTTSAEVTMQTARAAEAPEATDALATILDSTLLSERTYLGVLKSYNERRGFGFVACSELVAQFGRDAYLPKVEAAQALAATPGAAKMAEDDVLQFKVRLSVEGYPQAAEAKRLRKFRGVVVSLPSVDAQGAATPGLLNSTELAEAHGERAATVWPETVGQLRLVQGDEVSFCVQDGCCGGEEPVQAQLVCLEKTARPEAAVLGLFSCELPRDGQRPDLVLQCHAFRDKVVAAKLPADTTETELLHFFSKQGATGVALTRSAGGCLAAARFPGVGAVSRLLSSSVHAFADDTETKVGTILVGAPVEQQPPLPALPRPSLTVGQEPGVLLVTWSPSVIATRYVLEMRATGARAAWAVVDDSTGNLRRSECSSCRVTGLPTTVPFEARVSYATDCGTASDASDASDACVAAPLTKPEAAVATALAAAWTAPDGADVSTRQPTQQFAANVACAMVQAVQAGAVSRAVSHCTQPCAPIAGWQCAPSAPFSAPLASEGGAAPASSVLALPQPCPTSGCWQSAHGAMIPTAPPAPEVHWADEAGGSILVLWAPMAHAAAYAVELQEAGGSASERFVRAAAPSSPGCPVDLQIGGLRQVAPGCCYVARIRCIGAGGSESAPSAPGWSPPRAMPAQPPLQAAPQTQACVPDTGTLPRLLQCAAAQTFGSLGLPTLQPKATKVEPMPMLSMPFGVQDMQAGFANGAMFCPGFHAAGGLYMQTVTPGVQSDFLTLD